MVNVDRGPSRRYMYISHIYIVINIVQKDDILYQGAVMVMIAW